MVIAGILLIVGGIIVLKLEMSDTTLKIAGGSIAVVGLAFIAESFKKMK